MTDTDDRFPPIRELDDLPFMQGLSNFAQLRADNIELTRQSILAVFDELPDFDGVVDDAKEYFAKRFAVHVERMYEEGYQCGVDNERDEAQKRRHDSVRVQRNFVDIPRG